MYELLKKTEFIKRRLVAVFLLGCVCALLAGCGDAPTTLNKPPELKKITLKELATVKGAPANWITSLSLSSDNKMLASSGNATNVKIWKLADNQLVIADELKTYTAILLSVAFNPGNNLLAVAHSGNASPKIIDPASGKAKFNLDTRTAEML